MYQFSKYEGLGNDFIVLDARGESELPERAARVLCDRHFGVGADGVLLLLPPTNPAASTRLVIRNADGSRPEMCGNGIRCVALHLARRGGATGASYPIETDAGVLSCNVERTLDRADVSVAMGRAEVIGEHVEIFDGERRQFMRISMGNPHAVLFDSTYDEAEIDRFAPLVSAKFREGSNIEFARQRTPQSFDLVVWERGVGRTLACGTGAAATVVAAALSGRAPFETPIEVRLPGGPLQIRVSRENMSVHMRGPARHVFDGQVELP